MSWSIRKEVKRQQPWAGLSPEEVAEVERQNPGAAPQAEAAWSRAQSVCESSGMFPYDYYETDISLTVSGHVPGPDERTPVRSVTISAWQKLSPREPA